MFGPCGPSLAASIIFFELLILLVIYLTVPQSFSMAWDLITFVWSEICGQFASLTRFLFVSTEAPPASMASIVTEKIQHILSPPEAHGWIYREVWAPATKFLDENLDTLYFYTQELHSIIVH